MFIDFIYENDVYKQVDEHLIKKWILNVLEDEDKRAGEIIYNFVSESEILKINNLHLNHNYYTDIITFDNSFVNIINGDLFISLDTIKSNSERFKFSYRTEINRVIIHGIMHLCGHNDSTEEEKSIMRKFEDIYLAYLEKL